MIIRSILHRFLLLVTVPRCSHLNKAINLNTVKKALKRAVTLGECTVSRVVLFAIPFTRPVLAKVCVSGSDTGPRRIKMIFAYNLCTALASPLNTYVCPDCWKCWATLSSSLNWWSYLSFTLPFIYCRHVLRAVQKPEISAVTQLIM